MIFHSAAALGTGTIAGDLRPASERRTDVLRLQLRISGENLGFALATGQEIQNQRDSDTRTLDTRFAEAHLWVDRDSVKQCRHAVMQSTLV